MPTDNRPVFADDDTDAENDQDDDDQDKEIQDKEGPWDQSSASIGEAEAVDKDPWATHSEAIQRQAPSSPENTSRNNSLGGSNWATAGVTL